mmetsp:Transcript_9880/g.32194  ORF Transcript_9880/g.32194 Transcript_9880/m.32194 type:complete len:275 (-) Transcript_9880:1198-2022(-)
MKPRMFIRFPQILARTRNVDASGPSSALGIFLVELWQRRRGVHPESFLEPRRRGENKGLQKRTGHGNLLSRRHLVPHELVRVGLRRNHAWEKCRTSDIQKIRRQENRINQNKTKKIPNMTTQCGSNSFSIYFFFVISTLGSADLRSSRCCAVLFTPFRGSGRRSREAAWSFLSSFARAPSSPESSRTRRQLSCAASIRLRPSIGRPSTRLSPSRACARRNQDLDRSGMRATATVASRSELVRFVLPPRAIPAAARFPRSMTISGKSSHARSPRE